MIRIIAAITMNEVIGKKGANELLWDSEVDMIHFRISTIDSVVVMGNNTFKTLKGPLPNRVNIVLSNSEKPGKRNGVIYYNDYREILANYNDFWVIGGGEIYKLFMPVVDEVVFSTIGIDLLGDYIYFPVTDMLQKFRLVKESKPVFDTDRLTKKPLKIIFTRWQRKIERIH